MSFTCRLGPEGMFSHDIIQTGVVFVFQLKAYSKTAFLSTSFDMHMKLWNAEEGKEICSFKGKQGYMCGMFV